MSCESRGQLYPLAEGSLEGSREQACGAGPQNLTWVMSEKLKCPWYERIGYALMLHRIVCAHWDTVHVLDLPSSG